MKCALICLTTALLSIGCGDDDGPLDVTVESFTACGGSPVGVWRIERADFRFSPAIDFCPQATFDTRNFTISGTVAFEEPDRYSGEVALRSTVDITIPTSCFAASPPSSCSRIDMAGLSCRGDPSSACVCSTSLDDESKETGTWSTSGNTFTISVPGEAPDRAEYCVKEDVLQMRTVAPGVEGVMVLSRRT